MKLLILAILSTVAALAQNAQTITLPDIAGTGATVCLATSGTARWIQFIAPVGNTSVARIGAGATISKGAAVAPGGGFMFPPLQRTDLAPSQNQYSLNTACMYIASGDSVTVTYLP